MSENNYYNEIKKIIENVEVNTKVRQIQDNHEKLLAYWHIGELLVKAQGNKRAKYGDELIKKWSINLIKKYGNNYNYTNLTRFRLFYLYYPILDALRQELTWTHYRSILPLKNENERNYYINQVILNNLSSRELINEIKNKSFDRLSYADKENIEIIENKNYNLKLADMLKDPIYIKCDKDMNNFNELVLHKYIINMLENKFLELGSGFALVGHEYKITVCNHTYKLDLLFFNIKLDCYVVVEVKTKSMKIKDVDQLCFYTNLVDQHLKENHHKTLGILIVKEKDQFVLKYATNKQLFVASFQLKNI